ncbi:SGNH/GDSL hydrolase family protein [Streptomyces sp. NPDC006175]|uniref:SGNH/GDSL hydrolase family protein n=1 Tax=Streptomyces sp. NPDC006175 TaxID=3154471 RepID=UPI0033B61237
MVRDLGRAGLHQPVAPPDPPRPHRRHPGQNPPFQRLRPHTPSGHRRRHRPHRRPSGRAAGHHAHPSLPWLHLRDRPRRRARRQRPGHAAHRTARRAHHHPVLQRGHRPGHLPPVVHDHHLPRRRRPPLRLGRHPLPHAVVTFGDSLTDGFGATIDGHDRYPDLLAERLLTTGRTRPVLNAGIGSNKLLTASPLGGDAGLARFTRDVLDQPRVGTVIVLIGINDIQQSADPASRTDTRTPPITARRLIDGHRALIRAARTRGVRAIGATLTPYRGAAGWTPAGEAIRGQVNQWISTSGAYDAVVDFARAVDPDGNGRIPEELHIGDHLHPNPAGYRAMADAIELAVVEQ